MKMTKALIALAMACLVGCHTQLTPPAPPPPASPPSSAPPPPPTASGRFDHVFLVVLENRNYDSVIGRSSWPYLNSLAHRYALATNYTSVTHPSVGNYFELATGDTITNDDNFNSVVKVNNVVRRLVAAGRTWTSYAEDLPNTGYVGPDQGTYTRHHNVYTLLSDVADNRSQRQHLKSFSGFASDLAAGRMTDYVYIVPNSCDDGHDCPDGQADTWLRDNIDPLIRSTLFARNSALIITFDESQTYSQSNGNGWKVPWIAIGPRAGHGVVLYTVTSGKRTGKHSGHTPWLNIVPVCSVMYFSTPLQ